VASLAFVADRTLAQSQERFGLIGPDEDGDRMERAHVRTRHHNRNHLEGQIDDEGWAWSGFPVESLRSDAAMRITLASRAS
jgi:hypothetical protein